MKDNGDKFPADAKTRTEEAVKAAQELLKKPDATAEEFTKAYEAILAPLGEAAQAMNAAATPQPDQGAPDGGAPEGAKKKADGKVVDGDFEVVDDKK